MKVLDPAVTVLMVSHRKARWLPEAIESLVAQTRKDFEVVLADSGLWLGEDDEAGMAAIRDRYASHPLISWYTTGERPGLPWRRCPLAYAQNAVIRAGLVRGRYFSLFYDDDLYAPEFIEQMAGFLDEHPEAKAVWCSQEQQKQDGDTFVTEAYRLATVPKVAGQFDCQVDGGQVMMRTELLDAVGDPWMPEDPSANSCSHIDGLFFEAMAQHAGLIPPLPDQRILCINRRTTLSVNRPVYA